MSTAEADLKELVFRHQEISKSLIQVVSELREIKEVIKMIETGSTERGENKPEAAERHIRRLEEINAQLAARIDELEGRRR